MILKLKRSPGIYLVGFMGCGKSTIGHLLAEELGWRFVDLDERIEYEQGRTISSIFDSEGEPAFRAIETNALNTLIREVHRGKATVASLGGGAFPWPGNRERLEDSGVTVWLDVPFERVRRRVERHNNRPLARDPEKFRALFDSRREAYAKADYTVTLETDHAKDAVQAILSLGFFD